MKPNLLLARGSLLLLVKPNLLLARGSLLLLVKLRILLARGSLLLLVVLRALLARGSLRLLYVLRALLARGSLRLLDVLRTLLARGGKGRLLLLVVELRVLGNFPFAGAKGSRFGLGRCQRSLLCSFSGQSLLPHPLPPCLADCACALGSALVVCVAPPAIPIVPIGHPFSQGLSLFSRVVLFPGQAFFARELQSPLVKGVQKQKIFELETAAVESGDGSTWCVCVCACVCVLAVWCMWETCYEEKKSIHSKTHTHTSQCLDIY